MRKSKAKYTALRNTLLAIYGSAPERKIILYGTSCIGSNGKKVPVYISSNKKNNQIKRRTKTPYRRQYL